WTGEGQLDGLLLYLRQTSIMAKKQAEKPVEETSAPGAKDKPEAPEGKKARESGKGKASKEAKGKPEAAPETTEKPVAEAPGAAASPAKPVTVAEPSAKKKGKRPGVTPGRGKKLRNQLHNIQQKIAKEVPAPLPKAVSLLKQIKRDKFDETVEVHMS